MAGFPTEILLRKDIEDDLPRMEPRIELQNVNVIGKPDENRYDIFSKNFYINVQKAFIKIAKKIKVDIL